MKFHVCLIVVLSLVRSILLLLINFLWRYLLVHLLLDVLIFKVLNMISIPLYNYDLFWFLLLRYRMRRIMSLFIIFLLILNLVNFLLIFLNDYMFLVVINYLFLRIIFNWFLMMALHFMRFFHLLLFINADIFFIYILLFNSVQIKLITLVCDCYKSPLLDAIWYFLA